VAIANPPKDGPITRPSGFAVCPSTCEIRPNALDLIKNKIDNVLSTQAVCKGTGIWLEQGQKYRVKITAPPPGAADAWSLEKDIPVSTRGVDPSKLSAADRFWQIVLWPLKRHLFVEPFKVIARVGSTGSDEIVLEPDYNPKSNNLDITVTPRRSGELFLYANGPVWAWNWERFYRHNSGSAKIAVSRADD
jgi:hypothetical protein